MKKTLLFTIAVFVMTACTGSRDTRLPKADNYRQHDPAVDSVLLGIRRLVAVDELHSIMILKDGKKVLEYYDAGYGPDFLNICWSASKTFTATAVGFAVQDGLLTVEDRLIDHLRPEQLPETVSDTLASLTIYDLLRMASGLRADPLGPTGGYGIENPTKYVLDRGFLFFPGEHFKYNSHNTYLLSAVVTNVTGKLVEDYLKEKLFTPLGIRNYHWDISPEGYNMGGWGLYITTESLAKMGQFFLQKGQWNGRQLLDSKWIEAAMKPQIMQYKGRGLSDEEIAALADDFRNQGYGYQMWCCAHNGARLDGAYGQWSVILPDENAVIALTGHCLKTREEYQFIWDFLYPLVK